MKGKIHFFSFYSDETTDASHILKTFLQSKAFSPDVYTSLIKEESEIEQSGNLLQLANDYCLKRRELIRKLSLEIDEEPQN